MHAINYTQFRDSMKTYLDTVTDNFETVIVTRKNNQNVVLISEDAYNNLIENLHLVADKANYNWLMESKAQLESGRGGYHDLAGDADE